MDQITALKAFIAVVDHGGFAKAARRAHMATSSITRQIDSLERSLGVQLLNRSTRSVTLTPTGETYYAQVIRVLEDLDEANRSVSETDGPPKGSLRVSLPVVFSRMHVSPVLSQFLSAYPEVHLDLVLTDSIVNLVEERIDVALRLGALESSSLIARKLAPHRRLICASPQYLQAHGVPDHPTQLSAHVALNFTFGDGDRRWHFRKDKEVLSVRTDGPLCANNADLLRDAAVGGSGIVMMPSWLLGEDIRAGRLVPLLSDWTVDRQDEATAIHAVYLPNRSGSKKIRCFVDFLADQFGSPPYWDRDLGF